MKSNLLRGSFALVLVVWISLAPAYGASKEIIQLQTQVDQLQQQMTQMKQSFDERMGVMKNLVEQNTDLANKVNVSIKDLQATLNKTGQDRAGQVDQISGQVQALNATTPSGGCSVDPIRRSSASGVDCVLRTFNTRPRVCPRLADAASRC